MGLDAVELVMDVEDRFGIRIPDAEAERCRTVGDLAMLVEGRIAARVEYPRRLRRARDDVREAILALADREPPLEMRQPLLRTLKPGERRRLWRMLNKRGWQPKSLGFPRWLSSCFLALAAFSCIACSIIGGVVGGWEVAIALVFLGPGLIALMIFILQFSASYPPGEAASPAKLAQSCARAGIATAPADSLPGDADDVEEEVRKLVARVCGLQLEDVKPVSRFVEDLMLA